MKTISDRVLIQLRNKLINEIEDHADDYDYTHEVDITIDDFTFIGEVDAELESERSSSVMNPEEDRYDLVFKKFTYINIQCYKWEDDDEIEYQFDKHRFLHPDKETMLALAQEQINRMREYLKIA